VAVCAGQIFDGIHGTSQSRISMRSAEAMADLAPVLGDIQAGSPAGNDMYLASESITRNDVASLVNL
jgi:hypothetical protein